MSSKMSEPGEDLVAVMLRAEALVGRRAGGYRRASIYWAQAVTEARQGHKASLHSVPVPRRDLDQTCHVVSDWAVAPLVGPGVSVEFSQGGTEGGSVTCWSRRAVLQGWVGSWEKQHQHSSVFLPRILS